MENALHIYVDDELVDFTYDNYDVDYFSFKPSEEGRLDLGDDEDQRELIEYIINHLVSGYDYKTVNDHYFLEKVKKQLKTSEFYSIELLKT